MMPRPDVLFLVKITFKVNDHPGYYVLGWKEQSVVWWISAGFDRIDKPSATSQETSDASPPTPESIAQGIASAKGYEAEHCTVQAWDVSDHAGFHFARIRRPEVVHRNLIGLERPGRLEVLERNRLRSERTSSVAAMQLLVNDLDDVLATIEPVAAQLDVFGHRIRTLLLLACMEVESALRSILLAASNAKNKNTTMVDYKRLEAPMRLSQWSVSLVRSPERLERTPFATWDTRGLPWYQAYNATKHAREENLERATLGHVLDAVGAVMILLHAQFGSEASHEVRGCPFEIAKRPQWSPEHSYVLSPFDDGPWREKKLAL